MESFGRIPGWFKDGKYYASYAEEINKYNGKNPTKQPSSFKTPLFQRLYKSGMEINGVNFYDPNIKQINNYKKF